jgi:quercetin dioxygenase-like cupin family protein
MGAIVLDRDQAQTLPFGSHEGRLLSPDSGSYFVSEWTLFPGETAPPLHTHRFISESIYVVSGEVELLDGERSFIGTPGTFVHVPPGQLHGFGAILSTEPLRILMVQSPAEHRRPYCARCRRRPRAPIWPRRWPSWRPSTWCPTPVEPRCGTSFKRGKMMASAIPRYGSDCRW